MKMTQWLAIWMGILGILALGGMTKAETVTVTEPLMRYGLGPIRDAAWSPAGDVVATAGEIGVVIWNAESGEQVRILNTPGHSVQCIAWSADGRQILTGGADYKAHLWDGLSGTIIRTFEGVHTGTIREVALTGDSSRVVTASDDGTVVIWNVTTMTEIISFPVGSANAIAISPDGSRVVTATGSSPELWNTNTGQKVRSLVGHSSSVFALAFSADGSQILTGSADNTAMLWNTTAGGPIQTYSSHRDNLLSVAFSPDGDFIATGSNDNTLRYWNRETGEELNCFADHSDNVTAVSFSPDGTRLFSGSLDQTGRIWDVTIDPRTGISEKTWIIGNPGHTGDVNSVAFSPDGSKVLSGSDDYTAKLWDAVTGDVLHTFSGHTDTVYSVAFSPDGSKVLTGSSDYTAKLWDAESGDVLTTFTGHTGNVSSVAFSPDGTKVLTGSWDDTARLWDAESCDVLTTFTGHTSSVNSVVFSPDGTTVLTGSSDDTAKLWDVETGEEIWSTYVGGNVNSVAFSPDGTKALTGDSGGWIRLLNAETGDIILSIDVRDYPDSVLSVAFSPDGTKVLMGDGVSSYADRCVKLWDVETGEEQQVIHLQADVNSVAFSPDGTKVLAGSGDTAQLLDAETGVLLNAFFHSADESPNLQDCAFSDSPPSLAYAHVGTNDYVLQWSLDAPVHPLLQVVPSDSRYYFSSVALADDNSRMIASTSSNYYGITHPVYFYEVATPTSLTAHRGDQAHDNDVLSVALSADGKVGLSGSADNTAFVWNGETGERQHVLDHTGYVYAVAVSPDGALGATAADDTDMAVRIWDLETGTERFTMLGHTGYAKTLRFTDDGQWLLSGGTDNQARLWDVQTGQCRFVFSGHWDDIQDVDFSPDGSLALTGGEDQQIKVWDTATGELLRNFMWHSAILACHFAADGQSFYTVNQSGWIQEWGLQLDAEIRRLKGHQSWVNTATLASDGESVVLSVSRPSNSATQWKVASGVYDGLYTGLSNSLDSLAISPAGEWLLSGSEEGQSATLWDRSTFVPTSTFPGQLQEVTAVDFSPDGLSVLLGGGDGKSRLWNRETGNILRTFSKHDSAVWAVCFSPDGSQVATAANNEIKLWSRLTGQEEQTITGPSSISELRFTEDGLKLLAVGRGNAHLFHAESGELIRTYNGAQYSADISSDGLYVVAADSDEAKLWTLDEVNPVRTFSGHTDTVTGVAFLPGDGEIITVSEDGTALRWDSGLGTLDTPSTATLPSSRTKDKCLIVAGGGDYLGNAIKAQTHNLTEMTRNAATMRGYVTSNIYYLSAFDTPEENPKVNGTSTAADIEAAIRDWASDATRLSIFLIDHGTYDPSIPEWYFLADGTQSPNDFLAASDLDTILDDVQSGDDPVSEIFLYADMCYAGGFVKVCSQAPEGTDRLVIASTTDTRLANFGGANGSVSFTAFFLAAIQQGNNLYDCFEQARQSIMALNVPPRAPQEPWLDDNGDGFYSVADGILAKTRIFGNLPAYGFLIPEINDAWTNTNLETAADVTLWCETGSVPVKRAQAVVSFYGKEYAEGQPVTEFTMVDLNREGLTNRWSGTLSADSIAENGYYQIFFTATGDDGLGGDVPAAPVQRELSVGMDGPGIPLVSGPESPTEDQRPTWNWGTAGGGNGTFRYQLNGEEAGGWTETTETSWTPSAPLSYDTHTLYVQERDEEGLWSLSGSFEVTIAEVVGLPEPEQPYPGNGAREISDSVTCLWGEVDGATAYDVTIWPGNQPKPETPTASGITTAYYQKKPGLLPATTYFWQVTARNATHSATGPVWAFTTAGNRADMLAVHFYHAILNRHPAPNERDYWSGYFQDAVNREIDVRFVGLAMGSSFFNSPEYADRATTDADFIAHCYDAFWFHDATDGEIYGWTKDGEVQRGYAMSWFARSEEYVTILQMLFPGRDGKPINNFIATMYVGILDRLPTSAEIARWAALLGGPGEKRFVAIQMALELLQSDEFTGKGRTRATTNRDVAISLYQAFFGRYPAEGEIDYWAALLDDGTKTLEEAVHDFAGSPEFENTLTGYFQTGVRNWEMF